MKQINGRNWFFTIFATVVAIATGASSIFFFVVSGGDWLAIFAGFALGTFSITSLVAAIRDEPAILMLGLIDPW